MLHNLQIVYMCYAISRLPAQSRENAQRRGLSSVAFKCHRITQDNPGCLTNPMFKSDIYTKMSDLKKKKKGKNPFPGPIALTLTVTLGPDHPATSHCCRLWYTALSLTHQHYTRASQYHPRTIEGNTGHEWQRNLDIAQILRMRRTNTSENDS